MTLPETLSFDVAGPKVAGEGVPRVIAPNHTPPTVGKFGETIDNLYLQFARTASLLPGNKCMGKRTTGPDGKLGGFEFITYKTAHEQVLNIGSGLASLGMAPKSTFGLYGKNTMEWQLSALAGFSQALTCVPIYDTLGDNIVEYEANHSDMVLMFVEASKLQGVANVIAACKSLKYVVQLEPLGGSVDPKAKAAFDAAGVKLMDLNSLSETGTKAPAAPKSAGGDGLAFIMYTSGTTGDPKGVCITNMAIVAGSSWCAGLDLLPTDRHLSYLPLAHIFETMVEHGIWSVGGSVGFFPGNIKGLQDDILTLKPTIFVGVPRVYQRFYDAALQKVAALPGPLKAFLSAGLDAETIAVRTGAHTWYAPILHKLLGAKLTGGQVRIMISGAAPLPVHVQEFLLAACGGSVMQGYGMTENCANSTIAHAADHRAGHVGGPMPTCMIKLEDVPEMNYVSSDTPPAGEVVVKSVCNFAGYHKNKAETDKVLTADGWLHTGDIGRWNADGTLSIIDRKKNIFKLAQGEYVAAEKIEMAVSKSKYISQPWVYGNSFFPMLVAVVTPDFGTLSVAAKEGGWFVEGTEALAAKPEAAALILAEITSEAKAAKLKSFEIPKKVVLEGEPSCNAPQPMGVTHGRWGGGRGGAGWGGVGSWMSGCRPCVTDVGVAVGGWAGGHAWAGGYAWAGGHAWAGGRACMGSRWASAGKGTPHVRAWVMGTRVHHARWSLIGPLSYLSHNALRTGQRVAAGLLDRE